MPLFRIGSQKVSKVSAREFQNERELQILIDNNLEDILGVRLVASWFNIPNGQIDALGIDEQNTPVIIEYKWKQDSGAIVQGLFYLDWATQNRKTFELLVAEKLGQKINVKWNSPRLIIIAKDFTNKDIAAVNQIKPNVELKKYSYYGDLIYVENLTLSKVSKVSKVVEFDDETEDIVGEEDSIDKLLQKASPELNEAFLTLRKRILELGDDVWEKIGSWTGWLDYRKSSTFVALNVQTKMNRILVYIKMGDKEIDDPKSLTVKKDYTFGKLNTRLEMKSIDQTDDVMYLIEQAYEYVP